MTMPAARARPSPAASGLLDTTSAISAGYDGSFAASINAVILEPRPEMRTATRLPVCSLKIEMPVVDDAAVAGFKGAEGHHALASASQCSADRVGLRRRGLPPPCRSRS